ncbi:replication/maintenance protein RepL, partial [Veillonella sp.]|uniref:replication/maintenance protein RepL n=1 Tax=Veillonella sp. TaxID=1926307 RepID=UPI00290EAA65
MAKQNITSKKQKFVGYKELQDPNTGEVYPMQMNVIEDRDFNFHKVWLQNLIMSMDSIANQKLKLAFWIIDHLNKENMLVMTQRKIAEESGISLKTVSM